MPKFLRWFRHRKDLVPKPFQAEQGGLGTGKILCLNPLGLSKVV